MSEKILCPVDFSPGSHQALKVAAGVASARGAELLIAHAWHLPVPPLLGDLPYPPGAIDGMFADEERELAAAASEARELGAPRVSTTLVQGPTWQALCDLAVDDAAIELIVMGTRGRTGFRRFLLGSVAEQVIRHAPCSVMAVRGREVALPFRHVLVPIDFSESARQAVTQAARLATVGGAGIRLFHALDMPTMYPTEGMSPPYGADLERAATVELDEWAAELRAATAVPVTTRVEVGRPAVTVLTELEREPFDLVVLGSHGRTGLRRALMGSVAEQIVRHAPCPVLVARPRVARAA